MGDSVFAFTRQGEVTRASFMNEAAQIAAQLPRTGYALNVSSDRFDFALGLVAAWMVGIPTLLPSDQGRGQLAELSRTYPSLHQIGDSELQTYRIQGQELHHRFNGFDDNLDQSVVIPFTSGTTGDPVPHPKSLSSLMGSASLINRQLGGTQGIRMVATVPPQHMYGLELTLLLPLFEGAILDWRRPFFPADILSALRDGPTPVALVTTPLHLRALLSLPDMDLPEVQFIVSATAPLPLELAQEAETRFSAPLHEVYGCTELGSIAGRRPVDSEVWCWYSGVECRSEADGHQVRAAHVITPARVSDQLEILTDTTFLLRGRNADLVNIAGKRASIRALERAALEIQGVRDVAFIQGDEAEGSIGRLTALVVLDPKVSLASVKAALRRDLDPAFVPRTLIEVPSLPRNAVGKLPRAKLLAFLAESTLRN
ncbi:MAG: hypothetical protein RLZZ627_1792 [Pseudomonadota bacterium]|jgi:acyl-coenzyme A synthetase/AMP-(fatty) acid ligase